MRFKLSKNVTAYVQIVGGRVLVYEVQSVEERYFVWGSNCGRTCLFMRFKLQTNVTGMGFKLREDVASYVVQIMGGRDCLYGSNCGGTTLRMGIKQWKDVSARKVQIVGRDLLLVISHVYVFKTIQWACDLTNQKR